MSRILGGILCVSIRVSKPRSIGLRHWPQTWRRADFFCRFLLMGISTRTWYAMWGHGTDSFSMVMVAFCLSADINLLDTEYRLHSDRDSGFKSDKWGVEWIRETPPT